MPGSGFALVAEEKGQRIDILLHQFRVKFSPVPFPHNPASHGIWIQREKTIEAIKAAVNGLEEQVDLEAAGCYEEPKVTSEDTVLGDMYAKLQNYMNTVITYTFGTEREVLDPDTVAGWIVRKGNRAELAQNPTPERIPRSDIKTYAVPSD